MQIAPTLRMHKMLHSSSAAGMCHSSSAAGMCSWAAAGVLPGTALLDHATGSKCTQQQSSHWRRKFMHVHNPHALMPKCIPSQSALRPNPETIVLCIASAFSVVLDNTIHCTCTVKTVRVINTTVYHQLEQLAYLFATAMQTGMGMIVMQPCNCDAPNQADCCRMHRNGSSNMTPLARSTQPATCHVHQHHMKQLAPHILVLGRFH